MRSRTKIVGGSLAALIIAATVTVSAHWRIDPHHWGTHRKTIDTLVGVLHEKPCAPEKLRWLVWELRAADDVKSAGGYLDEVVSVCKLPSDVHELAFQVHVQLGQYDAAIRDASRRILIDGNDRKARLQRAGLYEQRDKLDLALADEEVALRLDASDSILESHVMALQRRVYFDEWIPRVD